LLLLKHIRDPDLLQKLPDILVLMRTLMKKQTGLQWLEVVIRYLAAVKDEDDLSVKQIKEIAEQAISKDMGEYIMTLAEKLRNEGEERGIVKGKQEGLRKAIELGITLKFPGDLDTLVEITKTIKTANDISEILVLMK